MDGDLLREVRSDAAQSAKAFSAHPGPGGVAGIKGDVRRLDEYAPGMSSRTEGGPRAQILVDQNVWRCDQCGAVWSSVEQCPAIWSHLGIMPKYLDRERGVEKGLSV